MNEVVPVAALSRSLAVVVDSGDTPETLSALVADCAAIYPAGGVAVLVGTDRGLAPLSATSNTELELELLQLQVDSGPCLEALQTQQFVWSSGADMVRRWPELGRAALAAGHQGVHAYPMQWRGQPMGGLNVFVPEASEPSLSTRTLGQLYADLASLAVAVPGGFPTEVVSAQVQLAMEARVTVERAKGVIAFQEGLDVAAAHDRLLDLAQESDLPLGRVAAMVLERAAARPLS